MSGFIPADLMDDVMDGVKIQFLGTLGDVNTHGGCTVLSLDTYCKVVLGGGTDNFT